MNLVIKISWNVVSYEGKYKILYNDDENTVLYNEYMTNIV